MTIKRAILAAALLLGSAAARAQEDPFAWLENGADPKVQKWADDQNRAARATLDALPGRAQIKKRLEELMQVGTLRDPVHAGEQVFYLKRSGLQNQPVLYVRDQPHAEARALIDPNKLDPAGTTAIDWFYPSQDGRMLAYGLSRKGSEDSVLHVRQVDEDLDVPDLIDRTRHASVAWLPGHGGFFYTRYPRAGSVPPGEEEYHRLVYYHELGRDPIDDDLVFGAGRAKEDWPDVQVSRDGHWLLVSVAQGWSKTEIYVRDLTRPTTAFAAVVEGRDAIFDGEMDGANLYIRTNLGAPRFRVMAANLKDVTEPWREIIPEGPATIVGVRPAGKELAVLALERAASRLRLYSSEGKVLREVPLPLLGSVSAFSGHPASNELVVLYESFFIPPTLYDFDVARSSLSALDEVFAPADLADYEAEQTSYPSKDRTPVTMFLVKQKWRHRNRDLPTLLTGYGGFNVSMTPTFSPSLLLWLERGGLYALPNLRGGGEYGEDWHRAGMLANKQNTFDDFISGARWLIEQEYTRPERLAIAGASNGGLLMGAAITQAPALFRAAVVGVPLLDMLNYHKFLLGRLWIAEYGSPDVPEERAYLKAYSPYHNVVPGVRYPAVLFLSGGADSRVDPMHARKMTALLQRDSASGKPALLRLEPDSGHGAGKALSQQIEELADRYAFLFWQLGIKAEPEIKK